MMKMVLFFGLLGLQALAQAPSFNSTVDQGLGKWRRINLNEQRLMALKAEVDSLQREVEQLKAQLAQLQKQLQEANKK